MLVNKHLVQEAVNELGKLIDSATNESLVRLNLGRQHLNTIRSELLEVLAKGDAVNPARLVFPRMIADSWGAKEEQSLRKILTKIARELCS